MAAGYTTSLLLNAQAKLVKRFDLPEKKHEPYNLIRLMNLRGQNAFDATTLQRMKTSDQRTVEGFILAKRSVTAGSARSGSHTLAALGDALKVTPSFSIISGTYGTTLKSGGRNIFERSEILSSDLESALISMNDVYEAAIATYFSTYKNTSNAADGSYARFGEFDDANDVWVIPAAAEKWVYQYIQEVMSINDYDVPLDVVTDNVGWALKDQLAAQGQANDTNTGWQFNNMNIVKSRRVADTSYQATFYVFPQGTVGSLNRIPTENIEGFTGKDVTYSSMTDPMTGLMNAVHYYESAYDGNAAGSETQDLKFEYENSLDYAMIKAPMTTGYPIFKFALAV